jgi:hypothetical protein
MSNAIKIRARAKDKCVRCDRHFTEGTDCFWEEDVGPWHLTCDDGSTAQGEERVNAMRITTRGKGLCARCDKEIPVNTDCMWEDGVGLWHLTCQTLNTVEQVEARVKAVIATAETDCDAAHSMEDDLLRDVLRAIADGTTDNPAGVAKAALGSIEQDFPRHTA